MPAGSVPRAPFETNSSPVVEKSSIKLPKHSITTKPEPAPSWIDHRVTPIGAEATPSAGHPTIIPLKPSVQFACPRGCSSAGSSTNVTSHISARFFVKRRIEHLLSGAMLHQLAQVEK